MRIAALLVLSLGLAPGAHAGLFGGNKKKLPKPMKMVEIRPSDAKRFAKPTKIAARFAQDWGRANQVIYQPQDLRNSHYLGY
jgi:hypothetical protein